MDKRLIGGKFWRNF